MNGASHSRQTVAGAQKEKGRPTARPLEEARGGGRVSLDLEKQAHCACVKLRKEVLGAEERAGEKEQRRWVYSRPEQDDSFTCSTHNLSR